MIPGATYPITIQCENVQHDLTTVDSIKVTIEQTKDNKLTLTPTAVTEDTVTIELTQAQSLSFGYPGLVFPLVVQVNYLKDGIRYPSYTNKETVDTQIFDEVMT